MNHQEHGDPVMSYVKPGMRMYAYDSISNTVLVGFLPNCDLPANDWVSLTVEEAKEHFCNHYGRYPTESEVF